MSSFYSDYMDYVAPFKGSKRYHRWSFISMVGAVMERRCWYTLGGLGRTYPNMYIFLVGGAGTGKSSVGRMVTDLVKRYNKQMSDRKDRILFGPDKFSAAALLDTMKHAYKKDQKLEQSPIWFYSSELSTGIKDIGGGSVTDDLLKFFDCDDNFVKKTLGGGETNIIAPCLNILACTTPSFISKFLPREQSGTGLAARIILVPEFGFIDMDEEVPEADKTKRQKLVNHIARIMGLYGEFTSTPEAQEFWSPWFAATREATFAESSDTFMRDFLARKPIMIRKIAMVLSASRSNDRIIQRDDYVRAIAFLDDIQPEMIKCFSVTDSKKVPDFAKQLLDALPTDRYISKAELLKNLYKKGITGEIGTIDSNIEFLRQATMINSEVRGEVLWLKRSQ